MVRLVVVAIVLALAGVLAPAGHPAADCLSAPRNSSLQSQGQDPVKQEPKKEDLPRKTVENKEALRQVAPRRVTQVRSAQSWTPAPPPPSAVGPTALDDARRIEHLRRLARPAVLQVFRN